MWKLSNYSLNYSAAIRRGEMSVDDFLSLCRQLDVEGASLHVRDLAGTSNAELRRIRRLYLESGLSLSMVTVSTNFGAAASAEQMTAELDKARDAIRIAAFLGAPLLRVFAGSPPAEPDRQQAFDRAAASIRRVAEEAHQAGIPVGLQNHNHGALCRTGDEMLRMVRAVDHENLTIVLDCGQFAGSPGASGQLPDELAGADYLASIRKTAPSASYVRVKFYHPGADGSEPGLDYPQIFDVLRGVHYDGFLDVVYEPGSGPDAGESIETAMPRIVAFLRSNTHPRDDAATGGEPPPANGRYAGIASDRYFTAAGVATETSVAFLEGPAVNRAGHVFFSNVAAEHILRWDPDARTLGVFRESSNRANGLAFDAQGRLLACEGGGRVTRTDMQSGQVTVLADAYHGSPLGSPNDLALDARGRVYFTSRLSGPDTPGGNVNAVYRIDVDGSLHRVLAAPAIDMPNGLVTAPDDRTLYLIDADGREARARRIRAFDLDGAGNASNERLLYDFYPGRSGDGMAVDAEGNLYVAAGLHRRRGSSETLDTRPGIHVISPAGRLLAFIETPEDAVTNCTFGGGDLRTLYITCGKKLLSVPTRIPGKPSYRPQA